MRFLANKYINTLFNLSSSSLLIFFRAFKIAILVINYRKIERQLLIKFYMQIVIRLASNDIFDFFDFQLTILIQLFEIKCSKLFQKLISTLFDTNL